MENKQNEVKSILILIVIILLLITAFLYFRMVKKEEKIENQKKEIADLELIIKRYNSDRSRDWLANLEYTETLYVVNKERESLQSLKMILKELRNINNSDSIPYNKIAKIERKIADLNKRKKQDLGKIKENGKVITYIAERLQELEKNTYSEIGDLDGEIDSREELEILSFIKNRIKVKSEEELKIELQLHCISVFGLANHEIELTEKIVKENGKIYYKTRVPEYIEGSNNEYNYQPEITIKLCNEHENRIKKRIKDEIQIEVVR